MIARIVESLGAALLAVFVFCVVFIGLSIAVLVPASLIALPLLACAALLKLLGVWPW